MTLKTSALLMCLLLPVISDADEHWPAFRGSGNSTTSLTNLPLKWSDTENIAWKTALAGYGQSSPVIWGKHIFVTSTGGAHKEKLFVEAFDLEKGVQIWKKEIAASQTAEKVSNMISQGAPTPATDADGVYAFFESGDLIALDHKGNVRWKRSFTKEYGEFVGGHGLGTSLVNTPDAIVLLIDHDGPSYLICLDKNTGENLWKTKRDPRVSWATPLYVEHAGIPQLVVSSNGEVASFRLKDGAKLWWVDGIEKNTVASPSSNGDLAVIGSSEKNNSVAISLGGSGDVSKTHLKWRTQSATSSFGSPLIHGQSVYFVDRIGALQSASLTDGSLQWKRRLPASTWASPLSAGNRLYFFCKNGHTIVLGSDADADTPPLATNILTVEDGDRIYGYAVAPGRVVIRTGRGLITVGEMP